MNTNTAKIKNTSFEEHQKLLHIWEECVATVSDIFTVHQLDQIRTLYFQHHYFEHLQLYHIEIDSVIAGSVGLANDKIELLFVTPQFRHQGVASKLLQHALDMGAHYTDVYENNQYGLEFYLKRGFEKIARSEVDSEGNPYPILHLKKTVSYS
jgi:putative acetyltransferase